MSRKIGQEISTSKAIYTTLKIILRQYRRMDASMKRKLASIGIYVIEGRKHYKLYYNNNKHHFFPLAKTPSGTKTGANSASRIYNNLILGQELQ